MRRSRFSAIFPWAAVALLAIAGFAAFSGGTRSAEIQAEAASASVGHASGAYAGLAFAYMSTGVRFAQPVTSAEDDLATEAELLEFHAGSALTTDNGEVSASISPTEYWLSEVEVRALVSFYFEAEDVNRAVRIAWCESRFDPTSVDLRTGGVGLFQHLPQYWEDRASNAGFEGAEPTDPEASVAAAAWAVYHGGGWDVFACRG